MQINIPTAEEDRLRQLAAEADYEGVELFVTEHVITLAHHPTAAQLAPLSDEELQASLEMCDRGMAEAEAGGGRDAREAMLKIARRRGMQMASTHTALDTTGTSASCEPHQGPSR